MGRRSNVEIEAAERLNVEKITENVDFFDQFLQPPAGVRCPPQVFGDNQVG
jgi:hypothetical protein